MESRVNAQEQFCKYTRQILNEQVGLLADVFAAAEALGARRLILQKFVCCDVAKGAALQVAVGKG